MSDADAETGERNYRNGYLEKTVNTQLDEVEVKAPHDRNGDMVLPQLEFMF